MTIVTTVDPTLVIPTVEEGSTVLAGRMKSLLIGKDAASNTLSLTLSDFLHTPESAEHCLLSCTVKNGSSQNGSLL